VNLQGQEVSHMNNAGIYKVEKIFFVTVNSDYRLNR